MQEIDFRFGESVYRQVRALKAQMRPEISGARVAQSSASQGYSEAVVPTVAESAINSASVVPTVASCGYGAGAVSYG
ncbi:hypothetical protein HY024_02795 [Candidatus Curtissbacteria bacterium]|nr:hypothetical protein [Candidatus Curtissbacteria bacterium]